MKKLALYGIMFLITAALAELGAWAIMKYKGLKLDVNQSSPHLYSPFRLHQLNPGAQYRMPDGSLKTLHSPQGFREDRDPAPHKPAGTFRIIMMGASTMYGLGADPPYPPHRNLLNNETVSHYLETALQGRLGGAKRVEVLNAGVTGYQPFQQLVYLNETIADYEPDLLLFLEGHNDFYDAYVEGGYWKNYTRRYPPATEYVNNPTLFSSSYLMAKAAAGHSHFAYLIYWVMHKIVQQKNAMAAAAFTKNPVVPLAELPSRYPGFANSSYLRSYRQIKTVADQLNSGMIVFLQPEVLLEDPAQLTAQDREIRDITAKYSRAEKGEQMKAIRTLLPGLFEAAGVAFQDIATIAGPAAANAQLYIDYCHLTPKGAEVTASRIAEAVWPKLAAWSGPSRQPAASTPQH